MPERPDKAGASLDGLRAGADVDRDETRQIVRETLRELGIDPEDFRGHQRDMAFVRRQREGAEQITRWSKRACVGAVVAGGIWLVVEGVKTALRIKGGP